MAPDLSCGPLFFFYIMSLITPKFAFSKRMLWHFVPFFTIQLYVILVYFYVVDLSSLAEKYNAASTLFFGPIKQLENYLTVVSAIYYTAMAYRKLSDYRNRVADNLSDNNIETFNWLKRVAQLFVFLALFLFINMSLDLLIGLGEVTKLHWEALMVYVAALLYYFGFAGYLQPEFEPPATESLVKIAKVEQLPQVEIEKLAQDLNQQLHIERVYLDSGLSAQQLAKRLDTSQKKLSFIINHQFSKSFRELINQLRVDEVKARLLNNQLDKQSVLSIALESGFNSEASFYRVFKKHTGLTPKAYIAGQQKSQDT